jgi:hypothetical protein
VISNVGMSARGGGSRAISLQAATAMLRSQRYSSLPSALSTRNARSGCGTRGRRRVGVQRPSVPAASCGTSVRSRRASWRSRSGDLVHGRIVDRRCDVLTSRSLGPCFETGVPVRRGCRRGRLRAAPQRALRHPRSPGLRPSTSCPTKPLAASSSANATISRMPVRPFARVTSFSASSETLREKAPANSAITIVHDYEGLPPG